MNKQEKQIFTSDKLKETAIMTIAVGIIAAAVYFFLIPKGVRSKDGLHQHPAAVVSCSI